MAKTNKALSKRIKITRKGKVLVRKGGLIHFRAKKKRKKKLASKKWAEFKISKKQLKQLLPYI